MTPQGPARRPWRVSVRVGAKVDVGQAGRVTARAARVTLLVAVAATAALWLVHERRQQARHQAEQLASIARGRALFHGQAELPGRLAGHAQALPAQASRCLNCHQGPTERLPLARSLPVPAGADITATAGPLAAMPTAASPAASGVLAAGPIGPPLNRAQLTEPRSRRHAPASRFDAASLCRALQTGVDPAQVMLPGSMPRYSPSPSQCDDLWAYLVSS